MIKPSNSHSRLVDELGRQIASGRIGHDGLLPREDDLVAQFAISRTIVREATKTLQALGLVVTRPRIGSRIQPMTRWRMLDPQVLDWITDAELSPVMVRDLLDLRAMIEPSAAELAAERATDEQKSALAKSVADMESATGRPRHRQADFAFHKIILEASHNVFLLQLQPALHAVLKGSFRLSMHSRERIRASIASHWAVADAIIAGDPHAARSATVALLEVARADIERHQVEAQRTPMLRQSGNG